MKKKEKIRVDFCCNEFPPAFVTFFFSKKKKYNFLPFNHSLRFSFFSFTFYLGKGGGKDGELPGKKRKRDTNSRFDKALIGRRPRHRSATRSALLDPSVLRLQPTVDHPRLRPDWK